MLNAIPVRELPRQGAEPGAVADVAGPDRPNRRVAALAGSPSAHSRSAALLRQALQLLGPCAQPATIDIRNLPAAALLRADAAEPALALAVTQVQAAELVLVATPIYKAAYSGVLKLFLDLLPPDALRGKRVLPLATGGSVAHLLAVDYALRPVLAALGAREILDTVFATDAQFEADESGGWHPNHAVRERLLRALADPHAPAAGLLNWVPASPPPPTPVDRSGAVTAAC